MAASACCSREEDDP
ncbi:hypothetical protein A2U01_0070197, partial [Trifolium medium]|nr:hypothetical protein [Trifolium medium]